MRDGFIKAAAGTPEIRVADCAYNGERIAALVAEAAGRGVEVVLFPELSVTGYTCCDLFLQPALLAAAEQARDGFARGQPLPRGVSGREVSRHPRGRIRKARRRIRLWRMEFLEFFPKRTPISSRSEHP